MANDSRMAITDRVASIPLAFQPTGCAAPSAVRLESLTYDDTPP